MHHFLNSNIKLELSQMTKVKIRTYNQVTCNLCIKMLASNLFITKNDIDRIYTFLNNDLELAQMTRCQNHLHTIRS